MLTADQILLVARAYADATGLTLYGVGKRACGPSNDKVFLRLERGQGISARSLEIACNWLLQNWPENGKWPADVPGGPIATVPPFVARFKEPAKTTA